MKATLKSIIVALTVLAVVVGTLLVLDAGNVVGVKKSITAIKVTAVDLSLTGTIRMTLGEAGYAYVSRRYVKKIKEALQLERRRTR